MLPSSASRSSAALRMASSASRMRPALFSFSFWMCGCSARAPRWPFSAARCFPAEPAPAGRSRRDGFPDPGLEASCRLTSFSAARRARRVSLSSAIGQAGPGGQEAVVASGLSSASSASRAAICWPRRVSSALASSSSLRLWRMVSFSCSHSAARSWAAAWAWLMAASMRRSSPSARILSPPAVMASLEAAVSGHQGFHLGLQLVRRGWAWPCLFCRNRSSCAGLRFPGRRLNRPADWLTLPPVKEPPALINSLPSAVMIGCVVQRNGDRWPPRSRPPR